MGVEVHREVFAFDDPANIPLSKNIPAVVMGITTGGGAHTLGEYIEVEPIEKGMESLVRFVELAGG